MNVADSSDHPLGIINLIRKGEKSIGFSIDENETGLVSFRSGGRVLYGIIAAGYNFKNEEDVYALEAGLGASLFGGPSYSVYRTDPLSQTDVGYKRDIAPASAKIIDNGKVRSWTGWTAGVILF